MVNGQPISRQQLLFMLRQYPALYKFLDDLTKQELMVLCKRLHLSPEGTKWELEQRVLKLVRRIV